MSPFELRRSMLLVSAFGSDWGFRVKASRFIYISAKASRNVDRFNSEYLHTVTIKEKQKFERLVMSKEDVSCAFIPHSSYCPANLSPSFSTTNTKSPMVPLPQSTVHKTTHGSHKSFSVTKSYIVAPWFSFQRLITMHLRCFPDNKGLVEYKTVSRRLRRGITERVGVAFSSTSWIWGGYRIRRWCFWGWVVRCTHSVPNLNTQPALSGKSSPPNSNLDLSLPLIHPRIQDIA